MTAYIWKGHGADHTGNWQTTTDWTTTGEPGAGDSATINNGTATEDINESFGSSLSIAALKVGPNGHLVIGDSAGADDATLDITGSAEDDNLGSITIYGGSELIAAADLKLGSATATGVLNFDGGSFSDGSLFINGEGVISMQAGALGSVSTNKGTIDATNPNSGFDYFTLSGGTLNNLGTLEATNSVSGSSGVADLFLTGGISVTNKAGSAFGAGSGAVVTLSDATVTSGTFTGQMDAVGVNDTIKGTNSLNFVNEGTISVVDNGSLTIAGGSDTVINKSQIDVNQGTLKLTGTIDNELNAEIVANGTEGTKAIVTSGSGGAILNNGALIADAGKMTFNNEVIGGQETIEDDGLDDVQLQRERRDHFYQRRRHARHRQRPQRGRQRADRRGHFWLRLGRHPGLHENCVCELHRSERKLYAIQCRGRIVDSRLGRFDPARQLRSGRRHPAPQPGPVRQLLHGHGGTDVIYSAS